MDFSTLSIWSFGFGIVLFSTLLVLSYIDFKTYRLPNMLTLPLIPLGILYVWLSHNIWLSSIIGALIGYGCFVALEVGFKALRGKDGLGRGDAKLLAAAGAWCGWSSLPYIILIASLSGIAYVLVTTLGQTKSKPYIAFGPFLALGFFIVWLGIQARFIAIL